MDYNFKSISFTVENQDFVINREDIHSLIGYNKLLRASNSRLGEPTRTSDAIDTLLRTQNFERFVRAPFLNSAERKKYSDLLSIPLAEIPMFQRHLLRFMDSDVGLGATPRTEIDKILSDAVTSRVLYLPTYRRIERDMREVFPSLEERYRRISNVNEPLEGGRTGNSYVELVNFGMEDVKRNIKKVTDGLQKYSLSQYNNLSASYLKNVIRGKADKYNISDIKSLDDDAINAILERVNEEVLSRDDKNLLRKRIKQIQTQRKLDTEHQDRYLAHYFSLLVATNQDIEEHENNIRSFIRVCNGYLRPAKFFDYDEISSSLTIKDDKASDLDLSVLSSGEKQIVSLFSHLFLEEETSKIIIIDEPELSLSVPWQRRFLLDIIRSNRCDFLLAVTHSPFVYENALKANTVDLRRLTERE